MKVVFVTLSALALSACASWTPRTTEQIIADRKQDSKVEASVRTLKRELGTNEFNAAGSF